MKFQNFSSLLIVIFICLGCSEKKELNPNIDKTKPFIELGSVTSSKYFEKNLLYDNYVQITSDSSESNLNIDNGNFIVDTSNLSANPLTNFENKAKFMNLLNSVFSYLNSAEFDNNLFERINKARNLINNAKDSLELQKALIELDKSQRPMEEAILKMMVKAGFKDQKEVQALSILLRDDKDVVAFNQKFEIMLKNKMEKFYSRFNELQSLLLQKIQEFRKKN